MTRKAQAPVEYLLIIGAVILIVAIVIVSLTDVVDFGKKQSVEVNSGDTSNSLWSQYASDKGIVVVEGGTTQYYTYNGDDTTLQKFSEEGINIIVCKDDLCNDGAVSLKRGDTISVSSGGGGGRGTISAENITPFIPDTNSPIITLISPEDGFISSTKNISITFSSIDNRQISSCTVRIGNDSNNYFNLENGSNSILFDYFGTDGTFDWNIICTDGTNSSSSQNRRITFDTIPKNWYLDFDNDSYFTGIPTNSVLKPAEGWYLSSELFSFPNMDCNDKNPSLNTNCPFAGNVFSPTNSGGTYFAAASSPNASNLVMAKYNGAVFTSTDFGATWIDRGNTMKWLRMVSCGIGDKLVAVTLDYPSKIYFSQNYGVDWTQVSGIPVSAYNGDLAASKDCSKIFFVAQESKGTFVSTNFGGTWTQISSAPVLSRIAVSSDALKIAGVKYDGNIFTSVDGGATWTNRGTKNWWTDIACSADGTKLVATTDSTYGRTYTSSDSGATWTLRSSGNYNVGFITMSDDGTRVVTAYAGAILVSTNSGATWINKGNYGNWTEIAGSADLSKFLVGANVGTSLISLQ